MSPLSNHTHPPVLIRSLVKHVYNLYIYIGDIKTKEKKFENKKQSVYTQTHERA